MAILGSCRNSRLTLGLDLPLDLFVPSNEDTAKTVHPPVSALDHPTPSFEADLPFDLLRFLLPGSNMQRVAKFLSQRPYLVVVVAFIQAEMLGLFFRGLRSINGDASLEDSFEHRDRQVWLRLEAHRLRDADGPTPLPILTPVEEQIEFAINEGKPCGRHVAEYVE